MALANLIKNKLTLLFESSKEIENLRNSRLGQKVLLVGDGISAAYAKDIFPEYDSIIVCNNSFQNIHLGGCNVIFHVIMEPDLFIARRHTEIRKIFQRSPEFFPGIKFVLSPFGRLFNIFSSEYKNAIYLDPFRKLKVDGKIVYQDFRAAFEATLGMALICGFQDIHCVGFDAWLLTPKNNLRWYSKNSDPAAQDIDAYEDSPPFLLDASRLVDIKVFSFGHYHSRHSFIKELPLKVVQEGYIPERDRTSLMREGLLAQMLAWEKRYTHGYCSNKG